MATIGSASDDRIEQVVSSLGTAIGGLGLSSNQTLTIRLDLDEPLNHGYDNFVGTSGTGTVHGGSCTIKQLAALESSVLGTYQQHWESTRATMSSLPHVEFVMGGDEAPAAVYNAPTFKMGDGECQAIATEGDVGCFIDWFHMYAMSQTFTVTAHGSTTVHMLLPDQTRYKFMLLDIGTTENDWPEAAAAVIHQAQNASSNGGTNVTLTGEIFAVINDGTASTNGSTPSPCPQRSYWTVPGIADDNAFCFSDMAAVAAAQVKAQDFLTYAANANAGGDPSLIPNIVRISSYDKQSPSHLIPDADPASLTSMIAWLYTPPAQGGNAESTQGQPPNTIFKLLNTMLPIQLQFEYLTDLQAVESMITMAPSTWQAHYPLGEAAQQQTISTLHGGITLQPLYRYLCNSGTGADSDYVTLSSTFVPPPGNTCSAPETIGNAAPYPDPCMLFDPGNDNAPYNYLNACPNAADIAVWRYKRTVSGYTQYYTTANQNDMIVQSGGGWSPDSAVPVFMVQPNWPRYQTDEPIGFQGGLRTNWGSTAGLAPLLNFFSAGYMTFGFQPTSSGNALAIIGPAGTRALICATTPSGGADCPAGGGTPLPCTPYDAAAAPLSCETAQGSGIMQSQYGGTNGSNSGSCCKAAGTLPTPVPGQEPVINFFPQLPYLRTYYNDDSSAGPNG